MVTKLNILSPCFIIIKLILGCAIADENHDYCVVGAGPSGLQMAHFLDKAGRDYIVLERNSLSGSSFVKFPRHRHLISANKIYTAEKNIEFKWRHDWNSLMSDDESLVMTKYSDKYFPHADELVEYFNAYAKQLKLRIKYNTNIIRVSKKQSGDSYNKLFYLLDANGNNYICNYTIMSAGIAAANIPSQTVGIEYAEGYESVSVNASHFKGQNVLILGTGNSAFEIAKAIFPYTNFVHITGRTELRQSWSTHYVGDIRGVNRHHLDTTQLKALGGISYREIGSLVIEKSNNSRFKVSTRQKHAGSSTAGDYGNSPLRKQFDRIIRCLGFKHDDSIYDQSAYPISGKGKLVKFPEIKANFESTSVPNMFFTGSLAHSLDFRKSSGGFIHGFRYSARALHHILEWTNHRVPWPSTTFSSTSLTYNIIKRINQASGLYQMFGMLCDVVILGDNGFHQYIEEFPVRALPDFEKFTGLSLNGRFLLVTIEYGKKFSGPRANTLNINRVNVDWKKAHRCNFIHPKVYYYDSPITELGNDGKLPTPVNVHHVVEDFLTHWTRIRSHYMPLNRFISEALAEDVTNYYREKCFKISMTHKTLPMNCIEGQSIEKQWRIKSKQESS